MQKPKKLWCQVHDKHLIAKSTKYGRRWACPFPGCTVIQWAGETSTPADAETRQARKACHRLFDIKWQKSADPMHRCFHSRKLAYEWLARTMGKEPHEAHIGGFNLAECEKLLSILARMKIGEKP